MWSSWVLLSCAKTCLDCSLTSWYQNIAGTSNANGSSHPCFKKIYVPYIIYGILYVDIYCISASAAPYDKIPSATTGHKHNMTRQSSHQKTKQRRDGTRTARWKKPWLWSTPSLSKMPMASCDLRWKKGDLFEASVILGADNADKASCTTSFFMGEIDGTWLQ